MFLPSQITSGGYGIFIAATRHCLTAQLIFRFTFYSCSQASNLLPEIQPQSLRIMQGFRCPCKATKNCNKARTNPITCALYCCMLKHNLFDRLQMFPDNLNLIPMSCYGAQLHATEAVLLEATFLNQSFSDRRYTGAHRRSNATERRGAQQRQGCPPDIRLMAGTREPWLSHKEPKSPCWEAVALMVQTCTAYLNPKRPVVDLLALIACPHCFFYRFVLFNKSQLPNSTGPAIHYGVPSSLKYCMSRVKDHMQDINHPAN